jgi:hypothetical protein
MESCSICKVQDNDTPLVCIREKGIKAAASKRGDDLITLPGDRKQYTNAFYMYIAKVENIDDSNRQTNLRSQTSFDFDTQCLFCGEIAKILMTFAT